MLAILQAMFRNMEKEKPPIKQSSLANQEQFLVFWLMKFKWLKKNQETDQSTIADTSGVNNNKNKESGAIAQNSDFAVLPPKSPIVS